MTIGAVQDLPLFSVDDEIWEFYETLQGTTGLTHAKHEYYRAKGTFHELTQRRPIRLSIQLLFYNSLRPNSFPLQWLKWRDHLLKGGPRALVDPTFGEYLAIVDGDISVQVNGSEPDGGTIAVQFESTLIDPDEPFPGSNIQVDTAAVADAIDADMATAGVSMPATPESPSNMKALDNQVKASKLAGGTSLQSTISRATGIVAQVSNQVASLNSNRWFGLQNNLASLHSAYSNIGNGAGRIRRTKTVVLQQAKTLAQFANEQSNQLTDVMALNPHAVPLPLVPKGTPLAFYTNT